MNNTNNTKLNINVINSMLGILKIVEHSLHPQFVKGFEAGLSGVKAILEDKPYDEVLGEIGSESVSSSSSSSSSKGDNEQYQRQQLIAEKLNINIVTCGDCGYVVLARMLLQKQVVCPHCGFEGEPCDFPDLFLEKLDIETPLRRE